MIILASLPLFSLLAYQNLLLSGDAWFSSWVFLIFGVFVLLWYSFPFFPLPPALHNTSSWSLGFSISAKYEINGSHFKASWKQNTLLHQHNYVSDHGSKKADSMEPPSTKPMPGLFWTWKTHVRCWPRALHCTGRIVSVVRKLDWCSRTEFAVVNFFLKQMDVVTQQRDQPLMVTSSSSFLFQP